jgi:antitoxin ParD1/3/4
MATMNISLPDRMKEWVEDRVQTGRYANASDYMRALVRSDQDYRERLARLQAALTEGLESGVSSRTPDEIRAEALRELPDEV